MTDPLDELAEYLRGQREYLRLYPAMLAQYDRWFAALEQERTDARRYRESGLAPGATAMEGLAKDKTP